MLPGHDRVTEPGFDNVYYDRDNKTLVITEEKNLGSEDRPGYIRDISAWDNFETNKDQILEGINESDYPDDVKQEMLDAFQDGKFERELVIGPNSKVSDGKLEEYGVDRLVRIDPSERSILEIRTVKQGMEPVL